MIIYPAIDLMGGKAVRLRRGAREDVTVYGDPVGIAKKLRAGGAEWLHLVDLEAAFDGRTKALPLIREIVRAFGGPVELGGGLRSQDDLAARFDAGVARCILGTAALEDPALVEAACARWPGQIAAGIDAKDGKVALRGWVETADVTAVDLALFFFNDTATTEIYTDISRDGMLQGPNIPATRALVEATGMDVTASGGVTAADDLRALRRAGCAGAILGKAMYENKLTLADALACVREEEI